MMRFFLLYERRFEFERVHRMSEDEMRGRDLHESVDCKDYEYKVDVVVDLESHQYQI